MIVSFPLSPIPTTVANTPPPVYGDSNLFCTCPPVEDTTSGGNLSSTQED